MAFYREFHSVFPEILVYRPFEMRAWSCVTLYYSPLRGSHCHTLDTVNPAMGMMLCRSMLAFEKVYCGDERTLCVHIYLIFLTLHITRVNRDFTKLKTLLRVCYMV